MRVVLDDEDAVPGVHQAVQHADSAAPRPPGAGRRSARPGCTASRPATWRHSSLAILAAAPRRRRGRSPAGAAPGSPGPTSRAACSGRARRLLIAEELVDLVDRQREDLGQGHAVQSHVPGLRQVAGAAAGLAGHVHIGQEAHLDP